MEQGRAVWSSSISVIAICTSLPIFTSVSYWYKRRMPGPCFTYFIPISLIILVLSMVLWMVKVKFEICIFNFLMAGAKLFLIMPVGGCFWNWQPKHISGSYQGFKHAWAFIGPLWNLRSIPWHLSYHGNIIAMGMLTERKQKPQYSRRLPTLSNNENTKAYISILVLQIKLIYKYK